MQRNGAQLIRKQLKGVEIHKNVESLGSTRRWLSGQIVGKDHYQTESGGIRNVKVSISEGLGGQAYHLQYCDESLGTLWKGNGSMCL